MLLILAIHTVCYVQTHSQRKITESACRLSKYKQLCYKLMTPRNNQFKCHAKKFHAFLSTAQLAESTNIASSPIKLRIGYVIKVRAVATYNTEYLRYLSVVYLMMIRVVLKCYPSDSF